jgi:hypothetical protein
MAPQPTTPTIHSQGGAAARARATTPLVAAGLAGRERVVAVAAVGTMDGNVGAFPQKLNLLPAEVDDALRLHLAL